MSERLENINYLKDSLNSMTEEELKRTLSYLIKVYVLDKETSSSSNSSRLPTDKNISFFDLMTALKTEYRTPELNRFQMESGKVYIEINNRRVEISESDSPTPMQTIGSQAPPAPVMSPPSTPEINQPDNNGSGNNNDNGGETPQRFRSLEF